MFNTLYRLFCKIWYGKKYYLQLEQDIERVFSKLTRRVDFELWPRVAFFFYEKKCIIAYGLNEGFSCHVHAILELLQHRNRYSKQTIWNGIVNCINKRTNTPKWSIRAGIMESLSMAVETTRNDDVFFAIVQWRQIDWHFLLKNHTNLLLPEPIYSWNPFIIL